MPMSQTLELTRSSARASVRGGEFESNENRLLHRCYVANEMKPESNFSSDESGSWVTVFQPDGNWLSRAAVRELLIMIVADGAKLRGLL